MLLFRNKRLLAEANREIGRLQAELEDANATVSHLRHLVALKNEENEELSLRISRMKERTEYADALEKKTAALEETIDSLSGLKKSMQRQIERLTLERDEARDMIEARDNETMRRNSIDFLSVPVELPPLSDKPHAKKNNPQDLTAADRDDITDWYTSPPEPSIE